MSVGYDGFGEFGEFGEFGLGWVVRSRPMSASALPQGVLALASAVDQRIFEHVYVPLGDVWDVLVLTDNVEIKSSTVCSIIGSEHYN